MTDNQPSTFYAVAYGYNRGVFPTYKEAMAAMKGFPQAVYKKFKTRTEAEEFVEKTRPTSTLFDAKETDTDDKFYAVARGRVIGIFKDLETVKKNIHGFPKPMHKKFTTFAEAKRYFDRFSEGKVDETKSPRRKRTHVETTEDGSTDGPFPAKTVARKRTYGNVGDTDESEGGGELDTTQILNETTEDEEGEAAEHEEEKEIDNKEEENAKKNGESSEKNNANMEVKTDEGIMDKGKEQKKEGEEEEETNKNDEQQQKLGTMEE
ncbi:Cauli_VI domain-containing protein [Meloidogyne graminicola]|uniref:Cauli_VI domain-containing protein n=1 Tax=Meloidogyne graminicola TaxID=189291 RepID=A0A8S9ZJB4_9BILA|nr:Cauli_VI domain-containing protein [Meloidogyne graminicola]